MKHEIFPPGPITWPPLRLLWQLQRDPLTFLQQQAATYGDLSHFRIGPRHMYLVNHPELIKAVLTTEQASFVKGAALQRAKPVLGNGLLTSEGDDHLQQRRRLQPLFHRQQIAAYANCMIDHAARLTADETAEGWQPGQIIDLHEEMMKLTLAIVGQTLFHRDLTGESEAIGEAMTVLTANFQRLLSPLALLQSRLPTRGNRRLQESLALLEKIVSDLIGAEQQTEGARNLVTMLVTALADEDLTSQVRFTKIRDELLTLLLAGHETTANALTFTWWLLAQHPTVAERFYSEIDSVCRGRLPTVDDVGELVYTRMVLSEALRLYPPAWTIGRQAVSSVNLGEYTVPAGATVLLSQWVMHRDERYYADPTWFKPERWRADAIASRPKYAFFPFGGGSRLCIGEQFAWMEGILLLATIGQRWRLQTTTQSVLTVQPGITLRPKYPLRMQVHLR